MITGAGSSGPGVGTGHAISVLFAREGAQVVLVNRRRDHSQAVLDLIEGEGGHGIALAADITNPGDCERVAESAVEAFGSLDVLVNNVGISAPGSVTQVPESEWDHVMAVNLKGMMLMSKYAIPKMAAGGDGAIVNISSMGAVHARRGGSAAYHASKGGVISLTKAMAVAHGRDHVRVNCVMPGLIYTPMVAVDMSEQERDRRRLSSPLGLEGTAWDVAWAAVFLSSPEARWITGVALPVDGGIYVAMMDANDLEFEAAQT